MTSLTPKQQFPYPTPTRLADGRTVYNEAGNGALHLQRLAEQADRQLDRIDASWVDQLKHPSIQLNRTSSFSTVSANVFTEIFMNNQVYTIGGLTGSQRLTIPNSSLAGYYHVTADMSSLETGAIGGIRRVFEVRKYQNTPGPDVLLEFYRNEELQKSGETNNHVEFVTFMDESMYMSSWFFHTAGSNVDITATATALAMTRLSPRLVT